MIEAKDTNNSSESLKKPEITEEVTLLINWLQQAVSTGSDILELFQLEMKLAITDAKRLMVLARLFVPILMLTWVSFSAALSWHIYLLDESVSQGLISFCAFQMLGLFGIAVGWKHYSKSLKLPLTRQHIRQFIKGQSSES
ncbi:hypothetical protein ACU6U9_18980 [Pseudomonas sp. HK3]